VPFGWPRDFFRSLLVDEPSLGANGFYADGRFGLLVSGGGLATDLSGGLYAVDVGSGQARIRRIAANGVSTTVATDGLAAGVGGIALDPAGRPNVALPDLDVVDNGTMIPIPTFDSRTGMVRSNPVEGAGIGIDALGNLFISPFPTFSSSNQILKISGGVITPIAGNGSVGYSGDGGLATSAQLAGPTAITLDQHGNVYFIDSGNQCVRMLVPSGPSCSYSAKPSALTVPATGGSVTVSVQASSSCSWAITGLPDWVSLPGNVLGSGSSTVNLTVAANAGAVRTGTAFIAGVLVPITQQTNLPAPSVSAVTNGATNLTGPVAPGEIVVIYGSGLGPTELQLLHVNDEGLVDTQVAGTQVLFNGTPAPIIYTSATQVAAVVPYSTFGSAQVIVSYQGQKSAVLSVPFVSSAPELFTADSSGKGRAAAVNQDGSINTPATPAKIGSVISLFATGEGLTSPPGVDGKVATAPLPQPLLSVKVTIGGQTAEVQYAGGAPGEVAGVMQINVRIPSGVSGNVPVVLQVGNTSSQPGVTIAVSGN
jgi:uncharacterized protein (TIGR03437 family)